MANPYAMFDQDENLEQNGIYIDYELFRVRLARSGGSNKRYSKALKDKAKPYRRAIQTETLDDAIAEQLASSTFVEACILGWDTRESTDKPWNPGTMHNAEGEVVKFTPDEVKKLFLARPELGKALQEDAGRAALYRREVREGDGKN